MYAEAAVDGSEATVWAPEEGATGSATVDLGRRMKVGAITVHWTDELPASSSVETSVDGSSWTPVSADASGTLTKATNARYVRVTVTRAGADVNGVRELVVTG